MQDDATTFFLQSEEKILYQPGDVVGDSYVLISLLAKGGMGVVYRARHTQLDRIFALKILAPRALNDVNWKRFELEARTLAKLQHPNVVQIFNMGIDRKGCPYYVMELLDGRAISEVLAEDGLLELHQFVQCFVDVCKALKFVHDKNIVHRDIKPSNLMLINSNQSIKVTKVVDFGIARLVGDEELSSQGLTRPGEVFGSPLYMSPEQTLGLPVTKATDIYSLGCAMFEIFSGKPPFKGSSALETMMMHQQQPLPQLKRDDCPPEVVDAVEDIIAWCMAKKPEDRFNDVEEILPLLDDVSRLLGGGFSSLRAAQPVVSGAVIEENFESTSDTISQAQTRSSIFSSKLKFVVVGIALLVVVGGIAFIFRPAKKTPVSSASIVSSSGIEVSLPNVDLDKPDSWLLSKAAISSKASVNNHPCLVFEFSPRVGLFHISDNGMDQDFAIGHIVRKTDKPVFLFAGEELKNYPQVYERFHPESIRYLSIKNTSKPPEIKVLSTWQYLTGYDFIECHIADSYFRQLGQLKSLKELLLKRTQCSSKALVASGVLSRLVRLSLDHVDEASGIVQGLRNSKMISTLILKGAMLGPKDAAAIASLSRLNELDLRNCRCTGAVLKAASTLRHLTSLDIRGVELAPGDLINLRGFKNLTNLRFYKGQLPHELKEELMRLCPTVRLVEDLKGSRRAEDS